MAKKTKETDLTGRTIEKSKCCGTTVTYSFGEQNEMIDPTCTTCNQSCVPVHYMLIRTDKIKQAYKSITIKADLHEKV